MKGKINTQKMTNDRPKELPKQQLKPHVIPDISQKDDKPPSSLRTLALQGFYSTTQLHHSKLLIPSKLSHIGPFTPKKGLKYSFLIHFVFFCGEWRLVTGYLAS